MGTVHLSEQVRRAARGDQEAAGALFDEYHPRIYRYALAKLGRPAAAEDVAAETFARALGRLPRFRWRGGGFEAWLFRIASNLIVDEFRTEARIGEIPDTDAIERASPDAETLVLEREDARELARILTGLPEDQREVLLLRFAGGLDTAEIGKVMDRKANAVRQLQFRALTKLRETMTQDAWT